MFTKSDVKDAYPLTPMQEGILYHYLMGSRGSDHFKQISYRITGEFNPERFQEAFNILIERHDILRTVFIFEKVKKSLQVVLKQRTSTIYFQDLTHLPGEQPERYIKEFKEKDKEKGFDLSKDILLRYSILQVSPIAYEIIILLHHIIIDGWSTGMLILEMTNIYRLLRDGKPVKLPRVTPYSTYIKWLEKQDNQAGLNHWKLYLKNYENQAVIPKIKVSKDYRYRQDQHTFGIGKILTGSLNRLAKENKTTTNTAFQAAWGLLLQKYNNSSDVVFGGVVSGRPAEIPGIEKMIGMFINTLPVRIQTGNAVNFIQLLGRVRTESIPCRKYEYVPLVEVQALTGLKQELLSHIIAFDNFPVEKGLEESSDGSKLDFSVGQTQLFEQTNYGIVVTVVPGGELKLIIRYNVEAYDAPHMKRLEGHFIRILQQVTQAPEAPLKQLKILSPGEERQLLVHFNDTEASYPNGKTIHRLFEEQVDRSLDNTAVLFQEQRLTYKELEEESNRLAAFLREKGVSTGSIVGLMLERSPRMIIGIFAILKAGGAYLPISPDYPRERVEYILADSNTSLLLTQKKWDNELEYSDEIIELDEKKNYPGTGKRLSIPNESTDPAYVIYTSGTTGKPKGTVIQHFSLVNRICWMQNKYLISTSDTILQKTPFTFDVSVWEMFWWAVYGAAVCFLVPGGEKEPAAIVEAIWKNRITVMHFVPSMLSAFLEDIDSFRQVEKISLLRQVFASGEALSLTQVQNFNRLLYQTNSTRLANLYGPTEATIDVTYFDCSTGEEFDKIPIGKPIDNMRLYILDKRKEILPVGISGELYIAGDGLSRGYLNNPELTAEKFIPNPFVSSLSKSQYPITTNYLYCTGDLARWLPDGNIEFLGRIDNQVKMRGFRIEPGEIENLLLTHEGVKEAVVSVIEAEEDSKYLCAYIVPAKELSTSQLTAHLATGLPEYMIPRDFVSLEKIPLTPNGKINRKALPLPEKKMGTSYSAPTNETEETLSQIWKAILNLEKVGIRDKFFSIGGDSIKAIRLISRLNGHFNADLKVADLYHAQTIEGLAQKISLGDFSHTAEEINAALQEIKEVQEKVTALDIKVLDIETVEAIYPMSDIEKGMVYYAMKNRMLYYYQDVFPVNLPKFEPGTLKKALQTMAVKHPALRTAFLPGESAHIIFKKIPIHLYYVDISRMEKTQQGENIKMYLKKNRETPLQEEISPLWRMSVFNTGNDVIVLAWEFHHAIMDGWSVNSFLVELLNTYFTLSSNPVFVPSKLKCTFKNFIVEHLIEKKKNENILYWQKELEDYQRLDFPKIPGNSSAGEFKHFVIHLGAAPVERLESIAWKYNTNLKHLCFAAYVYMLNMLSYENDLVVGLTSHNRPAVEDGDKLIGCFLNTIPVRIKIPPLITWGDYIRLVEEKMVEIKNYEGLSFVEIANATGEGIRNRTPITDNLFNFVDFFIREQLTRGELQQIKDDSRQFERYGFSNVSFGFTVNATKNVIMLMLDCFTSVLAEEQVHKLVKYFETILMKIIEEPDGAIGKAKIISIEEKQKLLYHWNNTASEYPKSRTIHGLFIEQVQKTPDTVCVVDENKQITYRQLNKEVQRISILLKTKGVGPGTITAVLIERSIELIVGLLGILNTGGTYLPLTPDYPAERTEYMLRDSNAKILLTSRSLAQKSVYIKDTIYLDQLKKHSKQKKALPSSLIHSSLDFAYVIYTSGSTGRPKGVLVRQGGLVNLVYQYRKVFKQDRRDYLSQVASPGFDAMAFEVWPCLLQGSTLHIVKDDVRMAPTQLKQWLLQKNITISFQSTAIGQQLLEKNWPEKRVALRALLVAGDQLLEYPGRSYPFRFYNLYGPTEDTVWTTYTVVCKIPKKDATGYPSIGKPIGNHRVYILAADMSPQPVEIAGELCISGDGVAAGYLNRPELTSEKFVLNPIIENPKSHNSTIIANTILYKTGDLARYLPDGNIEFLGRIDNQVKIRGFRIELGEIENQLLKFEEIKENIVLAKTDHMGEKYLCAYIVPAAGVENSIAFNSELREKLSGILPDYMIPTYFVQLNKIPLTPNGKVDRKVLPEPEFSETAKGKSYSAPGNEIEEKVAEIWADILRIEKTIISIDANFFQLGGHSIKATILASKIHKEFDSQMPLAEIFKTPTIRGIARYIKESVKEKHASIEPVEKKEYYAVSSPQKRLYILQQMEIGNTGYNMPGTIRPEEKTDKEKLEIIFKELVARHESLRTSFHIVDDHPVQVVHDKIDFKIDNYKTTEKEAETIINRFTRPFDLSRAPLLRVALVEIERSHRQALLIDMHHIITDGTSQEILGNEFTALYAGTPLPPITLQYKDYSEWLNRKEQQQVVKQQEGYWISQFSGELPVLNLPLDYSRPVIQSFEGASVSFVLTGSETRTLKRIAREL
ncbi:MAG: amino acid adenylation domain-containing protein, partial [bacterium]|nr:amino acid adenylation domain-containing protein [bacterium]